MAAGISAQQKPVYTQYILNNYIINPAVTGIEHYTDVKISHRQQWSGIEGAPVTTYVTIHGSLNKNDDRVTATSFDRNGENPRGRSYVEQYTAAAPHHGIGGMVVADRTGYLNRWGVYGTYAYHLGLNPRTSLSAGLMLGVSAVSLDASKIEWGSLDPNDPAIGFNNGTISKMRPEIGAGLWLYGADYFAGLSVLNIVPGKANFVRDARFGNEFTPHYMATAGYKTFLTDDISLLPSVMLQYIKPLPLQVYVNAKAQYRDLFWVGSSYRFGDQLGGLAGMAGINISNTVNIGYSYDVSTSRLRNYSRNTHEIVIGFVLGNSYGDWCPRQVW